MEIRKALQSLSAKESFNKFSLHLSKADKELLSQVSIEKDATYSNFGMVDALEEHLLEVFKEVGNSELQSQDTAKLVQKIVMDAIHGADSETAFVDVRISTPNTAFTVPRWHRDGSFGTQKNIKMLLSLKGPHTVLTKLTPELESLLDRVEYMNDGAYHQDLELRQQVADFVNKNGEVVSAELGEGIVHTVGSEKAAPHSEPNINEPRIFVSIVPGSRQEIEGLRQRWQQEKPYSFRY